jgi:hypothetical protein
VNAELDPNNRLTGIIHNGQLMSNCLRPAKADLLEVRSKQES